LRLEVERTLESFEPTDVVVLPSPAAVAGRPSGWIQTRGFDLAFFTLSPLVALPALFFGPRHILVPMVFGAMLGTPHYLSTFTFFFWDEARPLHRQQWAVFFGGPILIVSTLALAGAFGIPYVIQVVVYVWNTFHVARQSCGILSIYRHRAGVTDPRIKAIVNGAVISTSAAMAFWNIAWYPTLDRFMVLIWPGLPTAVAFGTAAVALVSLARLGRSLAHRFRSEAAPTMPELAFLATSLLIFHPYLWVRDANLATLGMLLGHFVQYLGLVWLVHRRKFGAADNGTSRQWLARLSTNMTALVAAMLVAGTLFLLLQVASDRGRVLRSVYEGGYLSLALVHFYLDGLFWAFRRAEVRRNLGPYLVGPPERSTAGCV
jgi:hypothetical protein